MTVLNQIKRLQGSAHKNMLSCIVFVGLYELSKVQNESFYFESFYFFLFVSRDSFNLKQIRHFIESRLLQKKNQVLKMRHLHPVLISFKNIM